MAAEERKGPLLKAPIRRVGLADIARFCNVSKSTVSRILSGRLADFPVSDEMKRKVEQAAAELGYRPNRLAQAIRQQRTHLIALSFPLWAIAVNRRAPDRSLYHYLGSGVHISSVITHPLFDKYDMVIHGRKEHDLQPFERSDFKMDLLDGMLYFTPSQVHQEFLDIASASFPIVLVGRLENAEDRIISVDIDNVKAAQMAVEHLILTGSRNILCVLAESLQHMQLVQDRLQGYRNALLAAGLPVREENIKCVPQAAVECGRELINNLAHRERIDGIFAMQDEMAAGCVLALKQHQIAVPGKVAVIGFSDSLIATTIDPQLSTVYVSFEEMTSQAVGKLLRVLEGLEPYVPGFFEIPTELVLRGTTRPCR